MPEPFPNHLVSVPRSVLSFKHYFLVHDQPFLRTAIYLGILAALITAVNMGIELARYAAEAPRTEARRVRELEEKLAGIAFKDGKATSPAAQPCVVYEDVLDVGAAGRGPGGSQRTLRVRTMLVVLDTTGKVTTAEEAAAFAGCPEPRRIVLLGPKGIFSVDTLAQPQEEKAEAYSKENVESLRKLVEEKGGKLPEFTLDEQGAATFKLEAGKVHLVLHTSELMVLVDATGKGLRLGQAFVELLYDRPEVHAPEHLALISGGEALLKPVYEKAARTLDFGSRGDLSAGALARWLAAAARRARYDYNARNLPSGALKMLFYMAFEVFVVALICSLGGWAASGILRAGIPYNQILTMAVYAMTPARLVVPVLVTLAGLQGEWLAAAPFVVGMGYTATGVYRTFREVGAGPQAPSP